MVKKEDYICYDPEVDFPKCIGYAKGVNVVDEMSDDEIQAMIDDGLVMDDDTHWNQLDNLEGEGEITEHEHNFIVDNFDPLRSWANFRAYIEITLADDFREENPDYADDIEHCPELLSDWTTTNRQTSTLEFISDDFDEIKDNIEQNPKVIQDAVKHYISSCKKLKPEDIESVEIVIKHARLVDKDMFLEDDCAWFPVSLSKEKEQKIGNK